MTSGNPKKKKKSGWDAWKAKKKAALAAGPTAPTTTPTGVATPVTLTPGLNPAVLKNHVAILLDSSGSMEIIRGNTINAFNEQGVTIKNAAQGQPTDVSFYTFDTKTTKKFFAVKADNLPVLTRDSYRPEGGTALHDGVIEATDELMTLPDANDPNTSFLFVIISDGEENSSRKSSAADVKTRIETLQRTGRWTFTYVGAIRDLTSIRNLGIAVGNSRTFTATAAGVAAVSSLNSTATQGYFSARSSGSTQSMDLYKKAEEALKKLQEAEAAKKTAGTP